VTQLKTGAEVPFIFGVGDGPLGNFGARKYYRGNLKRVEEGTVAIPVLLNGERVSLPAIHAKGTLVVGKDKGEAEFWRLDQPENPMTLRMIFKEMSSELVRIDMPAEVDTAIETGLASEACRAELHGVYFDTGSAELLPESTTTITRVADLLASKPDWRITIEGHTDNIGSEADNQLLSEQRAKAVLAALVEGHGLASGRFKAAGFGETHPIETNDTIEGRARNRRVELTRECP
jgi:outer membrane protein OmpA-like peptidoglycan-associated protein